MKTREAKAVSSCRFPVPLRNTELRTRNLILAAAFAFLLSLLGCLTPDFGKGPCCEMSNATLNGECLLFSSENDTFLDNEDYCGGCTTSYCAYAAFDNETNETLYVWTQPGWAAPVEINCTNLSNEDVANKTNPCNNIGYCLMANSTGYEAYPICTQREPFPWENPNCTTMLCGSIKYRPARSFLPDLTKGIYFQSVSGETTTGLYHATCNFYPLDPKTLRLIKKSKGVFQNTFRFGVGTDLSDFEEARWYFPLSDKFTGMQNLFRSNDEFLSTKDRFMNYLNLSPALPTSVYSSRSYNLAIDHYVHVRLLPSGPTTVLQFYNYNTGDFKCNPCQSQGGLCLPENSWATMVSFPSPAVTCTLTSNQYPSGVTLSTGGTINNFAGADADEAPCYTVTYTCTYLTAPPVGSVPAGWDAKFGESNYFLPFDPIYGFNNYSTCARAGNGAQLPPLANGENYWFKEYSEVEDEYNDITFSYTMPDVEKYKFFLQAAYWDQIYNSTSGGQWTCSTDGSTYTTQAACTSACQSGFSAATRDTLYDKYTWNNGAGSCGAGTHVGTFNCGVEGDILNLGSVPLPTCNCNSWNLGYAYSAAQPDTTPLYQCAYPSHYGTTYKYTTGSCPASISNGPLQGSPQIIAYVSASAASGTQTIYEHHKTVFGDEYEYNNNPAWCGNPCQFVLTGGTFQTYTDNGSTSIQGTCSEISGSNEIADFECSTYSDCITSTCSKEDFGYERGMCEKTDGTYANCLCHEVGTRMLTDNEVRCEPYRDSTNFDPLTATVSTYDFSISDFCHASLPDPESGWGGCKNVYVPRAALSSSQVSGSSCCLDVDGFRTITCYDPGSATSSAPIPACSENDFIISIYSSGGQYMLGAYPTDLNTTTWTCSCGLFPNTWNVLTTFGSASSVSCNVTVRNSTGGLLGIYQMNQGQSATVYSNSDLAATCVDGTIEYVCTVSTPRTVTGCAEELDYTGADSICNTTSLRESPLRGTFETPGGEFMCCNDYSCLPDVGECYNEEDPCYSVDEGTCYSLLHPEYCCRKQDYLYESPCTGSLSACANPPCPQTAPPAPLQFTYSSMCVPSEACAAGASLCSTADPHSLLYVFPHQSRMCCEDQTGGALTGYSYDGCENVTLATGCGGLYQIETQDSDQSVVCRAYGEFDKPGVGTVNIYYGCAVEPTPDGFCGNDADVTMLCTNSAPVASPPIKFIVNGTPYNFGQDSAGTDWGNYIGYSFADDFPDSMVAQECGLEYDEFTMCPPYVVEDLPGRLACLESMDYTSSYCPSGFCFLGGWGFGQVDYCLKSYAKIYMIKSLGNCAQDDGLEGETMMAVSSFPKINETYGWCEGSTFDTFAGVDLDSAYSKLNGYEFGCPSTKEGMDLGFFANIFSCNEGEWGPIVGISDTLCGPKIRAYMADVEALRDRIDHYLKSGVMPVVWYTEGQPLAHADSGRYTVIDDCEEVDDHGSESAVDRMAKDGLNSVMLGSYFYFAPDQEPFFTDTDDGCWAEDDEACTYSDNCPFIEAKGVGGESGISEIPEQGTGNPEQGAVELGCGANLWCLFDEEDVLDVKCDWEAYYPFLERTIGNSASFVITDIDYPYCTRVEELKKQCPRCLFAMKLDSINTLLSYDELTVQTQYYCYDAFVFDFEANRVYVSPNATTTETYYSIFTNMSETSRLILQKTGRPSLVLLTIDENNQLWSNYNDTFGFMRYAYKNQSDLVNSGIFGIMYKEWVGGSTALVSQRAVSTKDDKFCAFEQATDLYLAPLEKRTVYVRVDAEEKFTNASGAQIGAPVCVECNELEITTGQCSRTCLNMVVNASATGLPGDQVCACSPLAPSGSCNPGAGVYACPPRICNITTNPAQCAQYYILYANGSAAQCGWDVGFCTDYYEDRGIYCNPSPGMPDSCVGTPLAAPFNPCSCTSTGTTLTQLNCTLDPEIANDSQRCPMEAVDSEENRCVLCTELLDQNLYNRYIECNITYMDGSNKTLTITGAENATLYPDAIAVLAKGSKCCYNETLFTCCNGSTPIEVNYSVSDYADCGGASCTPDECAIGSASPEVCGQYYIAYADGTYSQCGWDEAANACNDYYEDRGIYCLPPSSGEQCGNEQRYTFTSITADSLVVTPVIFPHSGDPLMDCGLADSGGIFCGREMPVKNYNIVCGLKP